ncbi:MAG: hypothetical protein DHS20C16_07590 [Phycisphaerae bacterium]|nr:MAG: hypothetical protein DHS20C16_07590 [Phycisphaerae bacterium]
MGVSWFDAAAASDVPLLAEVVEVVSVVARGAVFFLRDGLFLAIPSVPASEFALEVARRLDRFSVLDLAGGFAALTAESADELELVRVSVGSTGGRLPSSDLTFVSATLDSVVGGSVDSDLSFGAFEEDWLVGRVLLTRARRVAVDDADADAVLFFFRLVALRFLGDFLASAARVLPSVFSDC